MSKSDILDAIAKRQAELAAEIEAKREAVEADRLNWQIEEWKKEHEQREQARRQQQTSLHDLLNQKPKLRNDGILRTWDDDTEAERRRLRQN
jgi:hypothetical protein